jgi:hypothetical protein
MKGKGRDRNERRLIEGCLANDPAAWNVFYERFTGIIRDAACKAVRLSQDKANLAEEIVQQNCTLLFAERRILNTFLKQPADLITFLTMLVYVSLRRMQQKEKRHRTYFLAHPEWVPEGVREDWVDTTRIAEFEACLPPKLRKFCQTNLRGGGLGARQSPISGAERQLQFRLSQAWAKFDKN